MEAWPGFNSIRCKPVSGKPVCQKALARAAWSKGLRCPRLNERGQASVWGDACEGVLPRSAISGRVVLTGDGVKPFPDAVAVLVFVVRLGWMRELNCRPPAPAQWF